MGEHTRKRKAVAVGDEISVTELEAAGGRNRMRAPAGLSTEAPAKSRRISGGGGGDSNKLPVSSSCLTRRRSTVALARDNTSTNNAAGRDRNSSPRSNEEPEVCSPTNRSSSLVLDGSKFAEEDKKFHRGKQANCWTVGPGSSNLEIPTEAEVEEFFAEAEKECAKRFMKKYNYDIVNDVPLEGRYEWSPMPLLKKS